MKTLSIVFIFLFCFSFAYALEINVDGNVQGVEIDIPIKPPFDNNTQGVNFSKFADVWITNEGLIDNVADILTSEITNDEGFITVDTNASTECSLGEYLDGGNDCIDFNLTVQQLTATTIFPPNLINTVSGNLDVGDLNSVLIFKDGLTYNVSEVGGANSLEIIINFTDVDDFDSIVLREWYMGGSGHEIDVCLWDYGAVDWECEYGDITDMTQLEFSVRDVVDAPSHIGTPDNNVSLRLVHIQSGNPAHDFILDYAVLQKGFSTITSNTHDSLSGRDDIENHPWAMATNGSKRNITEVLNVEGNLTIWDELKFLTGIRIFSLSSTLLQITSNLLLTGNLTVQGNYISNATARFSLQDLNATGGAGAGDNLGNHIATQNLSMSNYSINNIYRILFNASSPLNACDNIYSTGGQLSCMEDTCDLFTAGTGIDCTMDTISTDGGVMTDAQGSADELATWTGSDDKITNCDATCSGTTLDVAGSGSGGSISTDNLAIGLKIDMDSNTDIFLGDGATLTGVDTPDGGIEVWGDVAVHGTFTSDGGSDPPYTLWFNETRESVKIRLKTNIPYGRELGLVEFYNVNTFRMEYITPINCNVYQMSALGMVLVEAGKVAEKCYNEDVETKYYFDFASGTVRKSTTPNRYKFEMVEGYKLNSTSGEFYNKISGQIVAKETATKPKLSPS